MKSKKFSNSKLFECLMQCSAKQLSEHPEREKIIRRDAKILAQSFERDTVKNFVKSQRNK
jgi:hypothetical protein